MKKFMCFAVLTVFSLTVSIAQSDGGDFTLAPQLGVNFSTYSSSEVSYKIKTSFTAGVVVEYYFSNRWSLRSGLQYDTMGAKDDFDNLDKLDYLTIPINANWHFGKNRNWYLNFGPAVAILLGANAELSNGEELEIKEFTKSTDVGFALGFGYKFNVSDDLQLFIDYQGYNGFLDIDEGNVIPYDIRNARSAVNVGLVFTL